MERATHWNRVYTTKGEREVSWFEPQPTVSLEMLDAATVRVCRSGRGRLTGRG